MPRRARSSCLPLFGALVASAAAEASAQTACGFDCAAGTYRACNDDANLSGALTSLNCSASLGSCTGERFCATFGHDLPATAFPLDIVDLVLVAAGNTAMSAAEPFDLTVYEDTGAAVPGPQIGSTVNLGIPGSQSSAIVVGLSSTPIRVPTAGRFRVCLTKQFDAGHNVCLDTSGTSQPGRNWAFVGVALSPLQPCGPQLLPNAWYAADGTGSAIPGFPGLVGDFILRANVRPASPIGVPGHANCGRDAGLPADASGGDAADAGAPEAGVAVDAGGDLEDAGGSDDRGGGAPDGAPASDATPEADVGPSPDAATRDAGDRPAPAITEVTPRRGPRGLATPLIIVGRGFQVGAAAALGRIALVEPTVAGDSTLRAVVPEGIAEGTYDLVVTNPDGQAAVLAAAFTVEAPDAPVAGAKDGCLCGAPGRPEAGLLVALALLAGAVTRGRARRRA